MSFTWLLLKLLKVISQGFSYFRHCSIFKIPFCFLDFACFLSKALIYYITFSFVCQPLFRSFFKSFLVVYLFLFFRTPLLRYSASLLFPKPSLFTLFQKPLHSPLRDSFIILSPFGAFVKFFCHFRRYTHFLYYCDDVFVCFYLKQRFLLLLFILCSYV